MSDDRHDPLIAFATLSEAQPTKGYNKLRRLATEDGR
jgi:hypothetical protein